MYRLLKMYGFIHLNDFDLFVFLRERCVLKYGVEEKDEREGFIMGYFLAKPSFHA